MLIEEVLTWLWVGMQDTRTVHCGYWIGRPAHSWPHAPCLPISTFWPDSINCVDHENLPFPAIRCGEPEDIMNGILERKCQVLYSISTSISIISTSTTLSTMSFLIALPWRSDHSTWYFQTFGCRISYACEPGYQLLGRTHRSRPLSFLCPRCHMFDYKIQIRYFFFPLDVPTLSSTILCKIPALENSQVKSSCSVSFQKRLPNTNMSDCQTNKIRDLSETPKLDRNLWSRRKFIHDSDPPLHN